MRQYYNQVNETELIQGLCEHDEAAFRYLVEEYRNKVYSTMVNILQDQEEAEDGAQEVFIQVFESIRSFKNESLLSTWIYRITARKALDKLRRRKTRMRIQTLLPWWMPQEKHKAGTFYHPGATLEHKEKMAALFQAMKTLPERQRIALTLIRIQGMSYEEATEVMELSVKAIESLVSRGKENLEKQLKKNKQSKSRLN